MYEARTYRNWVEDQGLQGFAVRMGESDLFIRADKLLDSQARECLRYQRRRIQDYVQNNPGFATSLVPYSVRDGTCDIIREMLRASTLAGVGPMAAVAGAIAEYMGRDLLKYSSEVIVENGGDIFMKTNRARKIAVFAGKSTYTGRLVLEIGPAQDCWGICTSSGTVGHSLSFGNSDAAVVISHSAILADAWATRLGNMVKDVADVDKVLGFAKDNAGIKGVLIVIGEKMGMWGEVHLI